MINTLKGKAISATKWSILSEIAAKTISPLVFLTLTKILLPEDFGVVSVALLMLNFCQIIIEAGLTKTLIFKQEQTSEVANVVFWSNLALSFLIYLLVIVFSKEIAIYFHEPRIQDVLRVYGILIVIYGISSIQNTLLQKELNFKKLFWIRFLTSLTPGLFSIPLAFHGYGFWAILTGNIFGGLLQCIFLWMSSTWRPSFNYNFALLKELIPFSKWVLLESVLYFIIAWGDSIIAGRFLGIKELGVYTTGNNIVNIIFSIIFTPILPVLYSSFSKVQQDLEKLKKYFLKIISYLSAISLPIGVGLFSVNKYIEVAVFDEKWINLGIVIGLIAIKDSVGYLISINSEIYRSVGRPDLNVKLSLLHLLFIPLYIYSSGYGIIWFCIARITALITVPPHLLVVAKVFKLSKSFFWHAIKFNLFASLLMFGFLQFLKTLLPEINKWSNLIIIIFGGAIFYVVVIWFFNRNIIKEIFEILKNRSIKYDNL